MKAVLIEKTCSADELEIKEVPLPKIKKGWVLIKIKAFGINRSEIMFRSHEANSLYIKLPRIPGIECVGEIFDPSDTAFRKGDIVIALMGGMGRSYDGSYAEYALIPAKNVFLVDIDLSLEEIAAIPETYYTAYGSLFECLQLESTDVLLIHGATSALGLAAIGLAKSIGTTVIGTTRNTEKIEFLKKIGIDYAMIDNAEFENNIYSIYPKGVTKILELVGLESLIRFSKLLSYRGIICMSGILGDKGNYCNFDPIKDIPNGVYLSSFFSNYPTQEIIDKIFSHIKRYRLKPIISKIFTFNNIADAHKLMESNKANGKIVITIPE